MGPGLGRGGACIPLSRIAHPLAFPVLRIRSIDVLYPSFPWRSRCLVSTAPHRKGVSFFLFLPPLPLFISLCLLSYVSSHFLSVKHHAYDSFFNLFLLSRSSWRSSAASCSSSRADSPNIGFSPSRSRRDLSNEPSLSPIRPAVVSVTWRDTPKRHRCPSFSGGHPLWEERYRALPIYIYNTLIWQNFSKNHNSAAICRRDLRFGPFDAKFDVDFKNAIRFCIRRKFWGSNFQNVPKLQHQKFGSKFQNFGNPSVSIFIISLFKQNGF